MKISRDLNLVVPIVGDTDAETRYVHSVPIRPEVFKQYFLVLSKTLNALYAEGISQVTGPRVASLMLESIARDSNQWDGVSGVENGLLGEIRRSSNVVLPTEKGWQNIPLVDALKQEHLTAQEVEEAEGFIVFFTCIWHIHKRREVPKFLEHLGNVWDTQVTSLNCMEFRDSLPISTETATFVPTAKQSSVPG